MSDYTTAALIKARAGVTGSGDDTMLATIATAVSRAIDAYCGRTIYTSSATARTYDTNGPEVVGGTLWLDRDLASITSVAVDGTSWSASTDYVALPRNSTPYDRLRVRTNTTKAWSDLASGNEPEDSIVVTGLWCMVPDTDDDRYKVVAEAATQWGMHIYRLKDTGAQDVVAVTDGGLMSVPRGMPMTVKMMLDPFRKLGAEMAL